MSASLRSGGASIGMGEGGGDVPQLALSLTSDAQQDTLALVTETATASGGVAPYTYAWTLYDPHGTARTARLSSSTAAAPTWTPDVIGGAWVARCTVTDSLGSTAKAARAVNVGTQGWMQVLDIDFAQEADQSLSGGTFTVSNRAQQGSPSETLTSFNSGSASTFAIASGRFTLACNASTEIAGGAATQAAPGWKLSLGTVLSGYGAAFKRWGRVLVVVKHDAITFPNTNDAVMVGVTAASGPGESSSTGTGVLVGLLKQAGGVRPRVLSQVVASQSKHNITTGANNDATGSRTLVGEFLGGYSSFGAWSTDATDITSLSDCLALVAPGTAFTNNALAVGNAANATGDWMLPSEWELRVYNGTVAVAPGASWSIERIVVYVGGTA